MPFFLTGFNDFIVRHCSEAELLDLFPEGDPNLISSFAHWIEVSCIQVAFLYNHWSVQPSLIYRDELIDQLRALKGYDNVSMDRHKSSLLVDLIKTEMTQQGWSPNPVGMVPRFVKESPYAFAIVATPPATRSKSKRPTTEGRAAPTETPTKRAKLENSFA